MPERCRLCVGPQCVRTRQQNGRSRPRFSFVRHFFFCVLFSEKIPCGVSSFGILTMRKNTTTESSWNLVSHFAGLNARQSASRLWRRRTWSNLINTKLTFSAFVFLGYKIWKQWPESNPVMNGSLILVSISNILITRFTCHFNWKLTPRNWN